MSAIRTLASTENPLFSQASMSAAASASSRRAPEPADQAAADLLGERGQIGLCDRAGRQERRRSVAACFVGSRHEDTVGDAGVQMHMVVERRAEAMQEGDAAEPRAGGCGSVGVRRRACGSAEQSLDLIKKDLREGGDGSGRSARKPRNRFGTEITHCRTGTGGMT